MTVAMFTLATVHLVDVNKYAFREFIEDWVPDSESISRSGDPLQVVGFVTGIINVRSQLMVSRLY